jgi:hypothetical protein
MSYFPTMAVLADERFGHDWRLGRLGAEPRQKSVPLESIGATVSAETACWKQLSTSHLGVYGLTSSNRGVIDHNHDTVQLQVQDLIRIQRPATSSLHSALILR